MRILIVDDSSTLRKLIDRTIAPYGERAFATDGDEAVRAFAAAHADLRPFDLICLDIYMPGKNGLDALAEIRALEREAGLLRGAGVKIVMSTTTTEVKDLQEALKRGADAFLPKPYTREAFHEQLIILKLLKPGAPVPADPPPAAPGA